MFGIFRKSKAIDEASELLRDHFLSAYSLGKASYEVGFFEREWVLGYVCGFSIGMCVNLGISEQKDMLEVIFDTYKKIYHREAAKQLLEMSVDHLQREPQTFMRAMKEASEDLLTWDDSSPSPKNRMSLYVLGRHK